ncbi:MAG: allantoinase AllB [Myxococcales bacterium]|nr:allantoinase AllB [Myxococcales bacterium]
MSSVSDPGPTAESSLALRSRRVLLDGRLEPATVVVRGERVEAVLPVDASLSEDTRLHELGDQVLMAGLVDTHVHVNEPGRTDWEGFVTATRAAASGGITSLVDMPLNCSPVTTSTHALDQKLEALAGRGTDGGGESELFVDTAFWGGVVPHNAAELRSLAEAGVRGCKAFMIDSGIDEFPEVGEAELRRAMRELERAGVPLIAHAELDVGAPTPSGDPRSYSSYLSSRPPEWEIAAVELLIKLCRETGCPVHVVHLSAAGALPLVDSAKQAGLPITVETCPHYLCLSAEEIEDGETQFKCAPPIREAANRELLWQGLEAGLIDCIVSDHSPCTPALKQRELGDFGRAWGGIASLSLGLGAIWPEARRRGLSLPRVASWMSEAPAELAGLSRKGRIAPGCDADFVVWDPDVEYEVAPDTLHFKHKLSPYLGRKARGRVRQTWLRGRVIFEAPAEGGAEALTTQRFAPATGRPLVDRR